MKSIFLIPALAILYSACIVEKPTDCDSCIGSQCGPSTPAATATRPPSNPTTRLDAGLTIWAPDAGHLDLPVLDAARPDLPTPDAMSTWARIDALAVDAVAPTVCTDAGICGIPLPAYCTYSFQCGGHGRCANGQCQRACAASQGCGSGTECLSGFCQSSTAGGARCTYASECVPGATCINGRCFSGCTIDSDCPNRLDRCERGACRADTRATPQCLVTIDCPADRECVNAVCRTPCASDQNCGEACSGTLCRAGYCVKPQEAAPQCERDSACGAGLHCVDAICS